MILWRTTLPLLQDFEGSYATLTPSIAVSLILRHSQKKKYTREDQNWAE